VTVVEEVDACTFDGVDDVVGVEDVGDLFTS
jgi:hypothetical protein